MARYRDPERGPHGRPLRRDAGQDFEGPIVHDGGDRSIYLFDPEGNRLEIWDYFPEEVEDDIERLRDQSPQRS